MSALLFGRVWRLAGLTSAEQIVLLALADHAHDDGTSAKPGVPYLVWKTGRARSTVIGALRSLEDKTLIVPTKHGGGRGQVTEYRLDIENRPEKRPLRPPKPSDSATKGSDSRDETVRFTTRQQEPSIEPSGEPQGDAENPRPRNAIWDVLTDIYGEPVERFRSARAKVVSDLRELLVRDGVRDVAVAVEEIRRRVAALAGEWGVGKATANALVKHWRLAGELADQGVAGGLSPEQIFEQALEDERRENDDRGAG